MGVGSKQGGVGGGPGTAPHAAASLTAPLPLLPAAAVDPADVGTSASSNLQDILRLLTLWFRWGAGARACCLLLACHPAGAVGTAALSPHGEYDCIARTTGIPLPPPCPHHLRSYGAAPDVEAALAEGFGHVSIDTWLVVIPQVRRRGRGDVERADAACMGLAPAGTHLHFSA